MGNEPIFTVGHSNKSGDEFAALVVAAGIDTLVDVRSIPRSRWPQFQQAALKALMEASEIRYEHRGRNLGGKGKNVGFEDAIGEIVGRAQHGERIVLMCSEGDFHGCHRWTMLTPPILDYGVPVHHLKWDGTFVVQKPGEPVPAPRPPEGQAQALF